MNIIDEFKKQNRELPEFSQILQERIGDKVYKVLVRYAKKCFYFEISANNEVLHSGDAHSVEALKRGVDNAFFLIGRFH